MRRGKNLGGTVRHFYWWEPSPNLNMLLLTVEIMNICIACIKSLVCKKGHNFLVRHRQGIFPTMATCASCCWTVVLPPKPLCPWIISRRKLLPQRVHKALLTVKTEQSEEIFNGGSVGGQKRRSCSQVWRKDTVPLPLKNEVERLSV